MANHGSSFQKILMGAAGSAGDPLFVENVFSTFLYTGDGSNGTAIANGIDLSGEGGLVWRKKRTNSGTINDNVLVDTERGKTKFLLSNSTAAEATSSNSITSFNNNGFTIVDNNSYGQNLSNEEYVSWTFRKAPKFFDVVTYTGNDTRNTQISHNLGSVPGMIIVKKTSASGYWPVYHRGATSSDYYLRLNENNAEAEDGTMFDAAPTSTYFTIGDNSNINQNGATYVAYLFAHNNNDGGYGDSADQDIIKCGSLSLDSNGYTTVDLGFEPQWVLIKSYEYANDWRIYDVIRGANALSGASTASGSYSGQELKPNENAAEATVTDYVIAPNSTGFSFSATGLAGAAYDGHIYVAIRRGPMATPTAASSVFNVDQWASGSPSFDSSFPVDFGLLKSTVSSAWTSGSRLTGNKTVNTHSNAAQDTSSDLKWDHMDGFWELGADSTYYGWMWRRAPGYFDVVAYNGNGTPNDHAPNLTHNLGVVPEMIWVKKRSGTSNWAVVAKSGTGGVQAYLDESNANVGTLSSTGPSNTWSDYFTSTQIIGDGGSGNAYLSPFPVTNLNASGSTYIMYLFATVAGVSKVGFVSHSGSSTDVDCGFTSGAKFVLIKLTDVARGWYVFDTTRGIVAGNDPWLLLNDGDAQNPYNDYIDPLSSGFTITGDFFDGTCLFYAIAA